MDEDQTEEARRHIQEAMAEIAKPDRPEHQSRVRVCREIAVGLKRTGQNFFSGSYIFRDDAWRALALITEMAGELAACAVQLFETESWYAGAALVRQIIEIEYLMWLFSEDRAEPARWLASTQETLRREFSPARMRGRSRGKFSDREYWNHCELGGHPNPRASQLLRDHSTSVGPYGLFWIDLCSHLKRLWDRLVEAAALHDIREALPKEIAAAIEAAWQDRMKIDPLAKGTPSALFDPRPT